MNAREPATRGEARPSSDLVEGIARAIYEQRPEGFTALSTRYEVTLKCPENPVFHGSPTTPLL